MHSENAPHFPLPSTVASTNLNYPSPPKTFTGLSLARGLSEPLCSSKDCATILRETLGYFDTLENEMSELEILTVSTILKKLVMEKDSVVITIGYAAAVDGIVSASLGGPLIGLLAEQVFFFLGRCSRVCFGRMFASVLLCFCEAPREGIRRPSFTYVKPKFDF